MAIQSPRVNKGFELRISEGGPGTSYSTKLSSRETSSHRSPLHGEPGLLTLKGVRSQPECSSAPFAMASATCLFVFRFPIYKKEIKIGMRVFCCLLNEPTCWLLPEMSLKKHKPLRSADINKKLKMPGSLNTEI